MLHKAPLASRKSSINLHAILAGKMRIDDIRCELTKLLENHQHFDCVNDC